MLARLSVWIKTVVPSRSNERRVCDQRWLESYAALQSQVTNRKPQPRSTVEFLRNSLDQIHEWQSALSGLERGTSKEGNSSALSCPANTTFAAGTASFQGENLADNLRAVIAGAKLNDPVTSTETFLVAFCESHDLQIKFPTPQIFIAKADPELDAEYWAIVDEVVSPNLDRTRIPLLRRRMVSVGKATQAQEAKAREGKVQELLSGPHPIPIAISYMPGVLHGRTDGPLNSHASVIIGRKFNSATKECELLLRDSLGKTCFDKHGKPRYSYPCENGSVWVPATLLMANTSSLTWIPSKGSP
jgi:hypothetical protein